MNNIKDLKNKIITIDFNQFKKKTNKNINANVYDLIKLFINKKKITMHIKNFNKNYKINKLNKTVDKFLDNKNDSNFIYICKNLILDQNKYIKDYFLENEIITVKTIKKNGLNFCINKQNEQYDIENLKYVFFEEKKNKIISKNDEKNFYFSNIYNIYFIKKNYTILDLINNIKEQIEKKKNNNNIINKIKVYFC